MIISFRGAETETIFHNGVSRKLPADIQATALRKLLLLHAAPSLNTLRVPRGNQLEALKGDRAGQHSIRVNDQWRICFVWQDADMVTKTPPGARDVEIVDYHR